NWDTGGVGGDDGPEPGLVLVGSAKDSVVTDARKDGLAGLEDQRPDDVAGVVLPDRLDLVPQVVQPVPDVHTEQIEQEPEQRQPDEPGSDLDDPPMPGLDDLDERLGCGLAHASISAKRRARSPISREVKWVRRTWSNCISARPELRPRQHRHPV